jgi:hypothetical protein
MEKLFSGLIELLRDNDIAANIFTLAGIALMVLIMLW